MLTVGDRVVFGGGEHEVVALAGTAVRMQAASGEVSVVALPFLLASDGFAVIGAGPAPRLDAVGLLAGLPDEAVAAARRWESHLLEVETGLPAGAPASAIARPEYDRATRTLTERQEAKAAELGVTVRTVRRMRRRYREQGLFGLVNARHTRTRLSTGRVDERVVAAAAAVVAEQTSTSTGTKSRALRQIEARLAAEHGPGVVPMPSKTTSYRLLDAVSAGRHTFGSAVTRRQTAARPEQVFTAVTAARPGEQVQIDATVLDVMAVMDDGVLGRPELVAAVDVATRTIVAAVLRPAQTKAVDAALLLARMMVPEPMRPGWEQVLRMSASRLPYARLVDIDRRLELVAAKPVIMAETIVTDRGKVFLSETFLRAASTLGISVQPARPRTGTDKPHIERTFESINTLFCQHVSGYTGRDVTRRGADVAERAVWSVAELQELLDEWIVAGWQPRPHEGLRHPFTPDRALSPNEAYAAMVAAAGYVPVALTGEDYIELLPVEWRTIGAGGIQIGYRTYNCRELGPYRHQPSGDAAHGGRWEVHHDPYDVTRVWVRDSRAGGWITVPWAHLGLVRQPFAEFTWRYARRVAAERGVDDTNEAAVAVVLAALLARAEQGPSIERRALARARTATALASHAMVPALPAAPVDDDLVDGVLVDVEPPGVAPDPPPAPAGAVVPFGLFDALDEDGEQW